MNFFFFFVTLKLDDAMLDWICTVWLYDVIGGVMLGFLLGYGAGIMLLISEWYNLIDKNNYFTFSTGLTFLVLGIARLMNMDEVFSVFAAGIGEFKLYPWLPFSISH